MNLEEISFWICGVCRAMFADNLNNKKAPQFPSNTLIPKTLVNEHFHSPINMNVSDVMILGGGDMFNPNFQAFEVCLSNSHSATGF